MGREDVARRAAERTGLPIAQVRQVLNAILDAKAEALVQGRELVFEEFGVYRLKKNAARYVPDLHRGGSRLLPESVSVRFRPARRLGDRLNSSTATSCHTAAQA
jgi:nucleoid DNA-binding protein